jgi:hypothetical protein
LVTGGLQEEVVRAYFYPLSQTFSVLTTNDTLAQHELVRHEYFLGSFTQGNEKQVCKGRFKIGAPFERF